jgi:phenylacetic acid degradation operon negative regulatory protein
VARHKVEWPNGLSSRDLLAVVLGDYWNTCRAPIPSAALVTVLADLGVNEVNARGAIRRLAQRGGLELLRDGRRTSYRLSDEALEFASFGGRRLMRFGLDWPNWDGRWTCIAFSLAADGHRVGQAMRTGLRRLRMGQLYDGFWISPHDLVHRLAELVGELGVTSSTIMRSTMPDLGIKGRDPRDAFDLTSLRESYEAFAEQAETLTTRLHAGELAPAEAFTARTMLILRWREFAFDDPRLPHELLPPGWPMLTARRAFAAAYDQLGPSAETRIKDLVAPIITDDAAQPRHHLTIDT